MGPRRQSLGAHSDAIDQPVSWGQTPSAGASAENPGLECGGLSSQRPSPVGEVVQLCQRGVPRPERSLWTELSEMGVLQCEIALNPN